jgi:molecular chaperone GrpE
MTKEKNCGQPKGFTVNDARWWLRDDVPDEEISKKVDSRRPTFVEELESRLAEKDKLLQEYIQAHKSSIADMGETRERLERDAERRLEIEKARLAEPFLEVVDNLQRLLAACGQGVAMQELSEGVNLLLRQVAEQLGKIGLEPIATYGQRFDPKVMEALMTEKVDEDQDGMVLEEVRPGYKLGDHVVRPAGVRVGVSRE